LRVRGNWSPPQTAHACHTCVTPQPLGVAVERLRTVWEAEMFGNDPRWGDDPRDHRDEDCRDRDDEDSLTLRRGPSSTGPRDEHSVDDPRHRDADDWRGLDRDRDSRDRDHGLDPRDVFMRDLDLPRGQDREIVHDARDREYTLRGSESRTLSTVGAFRVVSSRDLRDHDGRPTDPRSGDLRHLRQEGLIRTERLDGHRDVAVVVTKEGRNVLESHRRDYSHGITRPARSGRASPARPGAPGNSHASLQSQDRNRLRRLDQAVRRLS
jgi:hypothetical protein